MNFTASTVATLSNMTINSTFNIAVTGNRPFHEYKFNTSQLVRDALPDLIKREGKRDIRVLKYHRDTIDTYKDVRQVSQDIWSEQSSFFTSLPPSQLPATDGEGSKRVKIDAILHLGMIALGWDPNQFRFETVARREGYKLLGDDGELVDSEELERLGLPGTVSTSFDVKSACAQVKEHYPDVTARVSDDAGLYFCEFRLYSSLAEPLLQDGLSHKAGRVLFEHLPQAHDSESIQLARNVTISFISALADDPLLVKDEE